MSTKDQRRQKKLVKKKSKEVAKRKELARQKSSLQSLAGQMKAAASGPIDRCMISEGLSDPISNFGSIFISRKMRDGRLAIVKFLVDGLCLGVKDVAAFVCYPADQNRILDQMNRSEVMVDASPAKARKWVEGAVAYAMRFGFEPHEDYRKAEAIWGNIDPSECNDGITYGDEEGKPRFVNGPFDSLIFQQRAREKLHTHAGEGNYNIVTIMDVRSGYLNDDGDDDDDGYGDWTDDPELDADIDEDVIDGQVLNRSQLDD